MKVYVWSKRIHNNPQTTQFNPIQFTHHPRKVVDLRRAYWRRSCDLRTGNLSCKLSKLQQRRSRLCNVIIYAMMWCMYVMDWIGLDWTMGGIANRFALEGRCWCGLPRRNNNNRSLLYLRNFWVIVYNGVGQGAISSCVKRFIVAIVWCSQKPRAHSLANEDSAKISTQTYLWMKVSCVCALAYRIVKNGGNHSPPTRIRKYMRSNIRRGRIWRLTHAKRYQSTRDGLDGGFLDKQCALLHLASRFDFFEVFSYLIRKQRDVCSVNHYNDRVLRHEEWVNAVKELGKRNSYQLCEVAMINNVNDFVAVKSSNDGWMPQ